jgi:hypothetical protein
MTWEAMEWIHLVHYICILIITVFLEQDLYYFYFLQSLLHARMRLLNDIP